MTQHVQEVLKDIKRVYPDYDPQQGYELAGFVWFQGFNDMVARDTYPNRDKPGGYDNYSKWMANFIRDVRKDLNAPNMPFAIGVMGVGGALETMEERQRPTQDNFRQAMAAPATMPESQVHRWLFSSLFHTHRPVQRETSHEKFGEFWRDLQDQVAAHPAGNESQTVLHTDACNGKSRHFVGCRSHRRCRW